MLLLLLLSIVIIRNGWIYLVLDTIGFSILLFFLSITWFKKIWVLWRPINEDDPNVIDLPKNSILRYLFNTSKSIMSNAVARMCIYFLSICVLTLSALIHLVSYLLIALRLAYNTHTHVRVCCVHMLMLVGKCLLYNNVCKKLNELFLWFRSNAIWMKRTLIIAIQMLWSHQMIIHPA